MLHTLLATGVAPLVIAQDETLLLGEDFLPWMVLAFGAAMVVGNVLALLRPPGTDTDTSAPVGRAVVLIVIGGVAAVWGLASLLV